MNEELVGLALPRMLRGDQAGHDFEQLADPTHWPELEVCPGDATLRGGSRRAEHLSCAAIDDH
jgi:hypothetical protein